VRLLLVTVHFAPAWIEGGVTRSMWNSARSLALAGARVQVVTTNAYLGEANQVRPEREDEGLTIRTVPVLERLGTAAHRSALAPGLVPAVWKASRDADLCLLSYADVDDPLGIAISQARVGEEAVTDHC